jgi:hypothetical protein
MLMLPTMRVHHRQHVVLLPSRRRCLLLCRQPRLGGRRRLLLVKRHPVAWRRRGLGLRLQREVLVKWGGHGRC